MSTWEEERPPEGYYRILRPDGELTGDPPDLSSKALRRLYRTFVLTRRFEERTFNLQRQGEISVMSIVRGQEATPLGSSAALSPGDWCFPTYRQKSPALYWGVPPERITAALMGIETETIDECLSIPDGEAPPVNFTPTYVPVAANLPNAVGSGLADRFSGGDAVSLAYVGDGSTSEGDFHEAMNFASVFDAPVVFICQNNQWAISVPSHRQTNTDTFAEKADAYGMPFERVDGNDLFAVYEKTKAAVERARSGDGPTFIECVTYRIRDHNTSDDASVYRSPDHREYWEERDPFDRFETYLRDRDVIDESAINEIRADVDRRVERAIDAARSVPPSDPQRMFDNHLHGTPWTEEYQRAELRAEQEDRNPFSDVTVDLGSLSLPDRDGSGFLRGESGAGEELTLVEAVNRALDQELRRDETVRVLGYDIGPIGGVFRATEGLLEEFGEQRVIDTPLSENGILGTAVGMAMRGQRPIPEIQFLGFFYPAFGQFMYTLTKMRKLSGGKLDVPATVRAPYGGGVKAAVGHSESTEAYFVHTPGVRVVCPSTPYETNGLLAASIRSDDPVIFLEPKGLYRSIREPVPEEPYTLPLDQARVVQRGADVTVLAWGAMVEQAVEAASGVAADVEIVDLRTLSPIDVETVLASVTKTGRCVVLQEARRQLGLGAELSALITEHALDRLHAPVRRATGFDVHFPGHQVEDAYLPDSERAKRAIRSVMEYQF